jgi:hypothetical protein
LEASILSDTLARWRERLSAAGIKNLFDQNRRFTQRFRRETR